jgi:acetylornithine deacetylase/succinyl-diaminopimelate desuccinylase-like protein
MYGLGDLAGNGVESSLCGEAPERHNLVAHLRGSRPGPALTLMGHMDVVPADAGERILVQGVAFQALFCERPAQDLLP